MQHACEPSSPSVSMDGGSGVHEHTHAHYHNHNLPAAASSRRARRSSSQLGEAPPPPPASHHSRHSGSGAHVEGECESGGCVDDSDAASAEAMAWAASFTGRLRCSLKALSRKFVRTINTGLFNHHHHHHHHRLDDQGASGRAVGEEQHSRDASEQAGGQDEVQGRGQESLEDQRYCLHQDMLRYSAIPAVHQRQYVLAYQQQQQQQQAGTRSSMGH